MPEIAQQGLIIGRFQPFHNEHLDYALAAGERCAFLWVGLSMYDLESGEAEGHRALASSNPLIYAERFTLVADALAEAGLDRSGFGIIPCPIDDPRKLRRFVPATTTCFITINEDWGRAKAAALRDQGYAVEILWERDKQISSTGVRESMRRGDDLWRSLVPPSVARHLEEWQVAERL